MSKTTQINMRVEPEQRALLTKAATMLNKDRNAFILDVVCREAENVLLNQCLFQLDDAAFIAFIAALEASVSDNEKLESLLTSPSPWE